MWLIGVLPNEVHCCTSREHVPQGFRFSDATGRITQSVIDQPVDPLQDLAIRPLPVYAVVPTAGRESEPHSTSSCSWRSPDRACWRLSSRRLALEGKRSRYAVSSRSSKLLGRNEDSVAASGRDLRPTSSHLLPGAGLDRFDHVRLGIRVGIHVRPLAGCQLTLGVLVERAVRGIGT